MHNKIASFPVMIGQEVIVGISGTLTEVEKRVPLKGEFLNSQRIELGKRTCYRPQVGKGSGYTLSHRLSES